MVLGIILMAVVTGCSTAAQNACSRGEALGSLTPAETCQRAHDDTQQHQQSVAATILVGFGMLLLVILTAGIILVAYADAHQKNYYNTVVTCPYGYPYYNSADGRCYQSPVL